MQLNDQSDYSDVLSASSKKVPSKVFGRGLVELDGVFEFQTAYPYKAEKLNEYIKVISARLRKICKGFAPKIPVLPEVVSIDDVDENLSSLNAVPIGIDKNDLSIATYNFNENDVSLISAVDFYEGREFYKNLIKIFGKINTNNIVIDAAKMFNSDDILETYVNSNFDDTIKEIVDSYLKQKEVFEANNYDDASLGEFEKHTYFIFGISTLFSRISSDVKDSFAKAISASKEYGVDKFILIDSSEKLKSFAYEEWYKSAVDDTQGIWIGNGISDQYTFKLLSTPRELREEIDEGFGYVIISGKAHLVKLVQVGEGENGQ